MKIEQISVSGLFGQFNHDLRFKPDERIAIMIGPNGIGKTTILRVINALFNQPQGSLSRLPFGHVVVRFDDESKLTVNRAVSESRSGETRSALQFVLQASNGERREFSPQVLDAQRLHFPMSMVEEWTPLQRFSAETWRDPRTSEILNLEEVLARYEGHFPPGPEDSPSAPDWLKAIRTSIPVRLIDTERLTAVTPDRPRSPRGVRATPGTMSGRAVRRFSHDLAKRIQRQLTEYGTLSQSLDRTFPARLVEQPVAPEREMDALRQDLALIESKRAELQTAGLLGQEPDQWRVGTPVLERVDDSRRAVLEVFARDAEQKLGVFDDLYRRVEAFRRMANSRLLYKGVTVGPDGLHVTAPDGSSLELEMLSSGEQHQLVLLYELLFRVPRNSFILIDEPELSLHVAWQAKFLEDLEEMATVSGFRVLLATHSPQIIGDRWDLTVELKGPPAE